MRRNELDCERCGACCTNSRSNELERRDDYVVVEKESKLLRDADRARRLVVLAGDGTPHMRMTTDGRCIALRGALGRRVRCDIYAHRPRACRTVQPGDGDCLRARAERGLVRA